MLNTRTQLPSSTKNVTKEKAKEVRATKAKTKETESIIKEENEEIEAMNEVKVKEKEKIETNVVKGKKANSPEEETVGKAVATNGQATHGEPETPGRKVRSGTRRKSSAPFGKATMIMIKVQAEATGRAQMRGVMKPETIDVPNEMERRKPR